MPHDSSSSAVPLTPPTPLIDFLLLRPWKRLVYYLYIHYQYRHNPL